MTHLPGPIVIDLPRARASLGFDRLVPAIATSGGLANAIRGRNPALQLENKYVVSEAPMGIGLRRGDPDLLHWLNTAIFMLWTNREIQPLQQQWMGAVNADLPRYS